MIYDNEPCNYWPIRLKSDLLRIHKTRTSVDFDRFNGHFVKITKLTQCDNSVFEFDAHHSICGRECTSFNSTGTLSYDDRSISRKDGPAFTEVIEDGPEGARREYTYEYWFQNGKKHRLDGPADIRYNSKSKTERWFVNDSEIPWFELYATKERFLEYIFEPTKPFNLSVLEKNILAVLEIAITHGWIDQTAADSILATRSLV